MNKKCELKKNVNLLDYNTYRVEARCHYMAHPATLKDLENLLTYVINHQKSYNISKENMYSFDRRDEEEQLQRNRDEILQKQSAKLMSSQMIQMNNTLEEFKTVCGLIPIKS